MFPLPRVPVFWNSVLFFWVHVSTTPGQPGFLRIPVVLLERATVSRRRRGGSLGDGGFLGGPGPAAGAGCLGFPKISRSSVVAGKSWLFGGFVLLLLCFTFLLGG